MGRRGPKDAAVQCVDCGGPLRGEGMRKPPCHGRSLGIDGWLCGRCYDRRYGRLRPRKTGRRVRPEGER